MIFMKTIDLVLSGRKTQTLRLAHLNDVLGPFSKKTAVIATVYDGAKGMMQYRYRPRWVVGRTYAVQPGRCMPAAGRIRVTDLSEILDPLKVDLAFIRREGFDSAEPYLRIWHELHGPRPRFDGAWRSWAIGFELVKAADGIFN